MTLEDWLNNGWLVAHKTSRQEIGDLLDVADRDLVDCQVEGLSADWKMNIAYNAALQSATAALAAAGYRPTRDSHHYRVIQSLAYTIGADTKVTAKFNEFRKKRNIGGYERAGLVSDREADEMLELAQQLRGWVERWIRENPPAYG
jgi:HEPN domain-containing protein